MRLFLSLASMFAWALMTTASHGATPGDYVFQGDIDLGGPGFWDYSSFDAAGHRLCVAHVDKISVVDVGAGKLAGAVGPIDEAHGTAIVPGLGKGFASSGGDGVVKVFDTGDLRVIKTIAVGKDADGVIWDLATKSVIVMVGEAKQIAIIDPASDTVARTVALPDGPEFGAIDGMGKLFVNLAASAKLARIDIASGRLEAAWPLTGCKPPHGLAYDPRTRRLFSGCSNKVLIVVDPATGRNVASVPIGAYGDAVAVDSARGRVFSPKGEGTLTVIQERPNDSYGVVRTIPTFIGARSMAVDPASGGLYLVHGETKIKGGLPNPLALRFGWDNARIAVFTPND